MTKDELITKYVNKCNKANVKSQEMRASKHKNKHINPEEARLDELEQESYSTEFHLCEEILKDLKNMTT